MEVHVVLVDVFDHLDLGLRCEVTLLLRLVLHRPVPLFERHVHLLPVGTALGPEFTVWFLGFF